MVVFVERRRFMKHGVRLAAVLLLMAVVLGDLDFTDLHCDRWHFADNQVPG